MSILSQLNTAPMFLIAGTVILFILGLSVAFLVRSWREMCIRDRYIIICVTVS